MSNDNALPAGQATEDLDVMIDEIMLAAIRALKGNLITPATDAPENIWKIFRLIRDLIDEIIAGLTEESDFLSNDDARKVTDPLNKMPSPLAMRLRAILVDMMFLKLSLRVSGQVQIETAASEVIQSMDGALEALKQLLPSWEITPHFIRGTIIPVGPSS